MIVGTTHSPKKSTSTATFRLSSQVIAEICTIAKSRNISPDTLVNQIIKTHIDWHSLAPHAMLCYMPESFLTRIMNKLIEQELGELARETAKKDLVDISMFLRGGFNIASISEITETWLKISQMSYRCEINENSCKIIINHHMGHKYSFLIKEIARYLLEVAFEAKSNFSITENMVTIELDL